MERWHVFVAYNENDELVYESKRYKRVSMSYVAANIYKSKHPDHIVIVQLLSDSEILWYETIK